VVERLLTLLRALVSAACAGELVILSARGFVVGSTHPLARYFCERERRLRLICSHGGLLNRRGEGGWGGVLKGEWAPYNHGQVIEAADGVGGRIVSRGAWQIVV
jgi:hypothetical protein